MMSASVEHIEQFGTAFNQWMQSKAAQVEINNRPGVIVTPFETRAQILVARGIPVAPIPAGTKAAKLSNWENLATTDLAKITEWGSNGYANGNTAAVAKAQPGGTFFLEIDKRNFHLDIEKQTGQKFPDAFKVSSRPGEGRGHLYFRHTPETIALAQQIAKAYISGKDENGKEAWSLRWNNAYVVGPSSIHPDTGKLYEIRRDVEIAPGPLWLVQWCVNNQETKKTGDVELDDQSPILGPANGFPGNRDVELTRIAGRARQVMKMDKEQLFTYLCDVNRKRCVPPLPEEGPEGIKKIVNSIGSKPIVDTTPIKVPFNGYTQAQADAVAKAADAPKIDPIPYPVFPTWVFGGIPAYDKWIKPFCKVNSRYPEYMMLPLMTFVLNYLSLKVQITDKRFPLSVFLLLVGKKGRVIKSSSAQDAMEFCRQMTILDEHGPSTPKIAAGQTLVFTVGSTESLGAEMAKTNCKNAVLFYDEFSKLVAKMGIENSSFANDLSTTYESGRFGNSSNSHQTHSFAFQPGSYCVSLIGCTTDKRYPRLASKLFSTVDGMDERFFVLYQPEVLKDVTPLKFVPARQGVVTETHEQIKKAMLKKGYRIDFEEPLNEISKLGNRIEIRAEKWALAFAVLLGKDSIDENCIERGIALAKYEHAAKKYLAVGESITRDGALQREIRLTIERAGGSMKVRDLQRKVNYDDYDTGLWYRVYGGLLLNKILVETGAGVPGDPKIVTVLVPLLRDEEDEE